MENDQIIVELSELASPLGRSQHRRRQAQNDDGEEYSPSSNPASSRSEVG